MGCAIKDQIHRVNPAGSRGKDSEEVSEWTLHGH